MLAVKAMESSRFTFNPTQILQGIVLLMPFAIVLPLGVDLGPFTVALPDVLVLILFPASCLLRQRGSKSGVIRLRYDIILVFALALAVVVSAAAANSLNGSIIQIVRFIEAAMLIYAVDRIIAISDFHPERLFTALKLAGVLAAVVSILQGFLGFGRLFAEQASASGARTAGLTHGGAYGAILMTGLLLITIDLIEKGGKRTGLNILGLAVITLGMLYTQTRAWFVAAAIALFFYAIYARARYFVFFVVLTPLLLTFAWVVLVNLGGLTLLFGSDAASVVERFAQVTYIFSGNVEETSLYIRLLKWELAIEQWRSSPLLGVGPGNMLLQLPYRTNLIWIKSDSEWIDMLTQYGVIGGLLFAVLTLGLAVRVFRLVRRKGHRDKAYAIRYLTIYIGWLAGSVFWSITTGYMLLYFAFVCAIGIRAQRTFTVRPAEKRSAATYQPSTRPATT